MRTDAETSPSDAPEDEDWEPLVDEINTIDRAQDGSLVVYICWKNGKSTEHPAEVAYKRCPQKMLQFYEGRLRFRPK
ncbi:hypothetical protein LPJ61_006050 [Coemansia biformis]|uniref:Chromo shadow domain-containing protein n=1 Tax=Coemansia biformis TaxID=1286918 RepID=A0A9W7XZW6_9FUNG|nr:hypothetical protein LPJ61_006050 [Coemansia biformis]